MRVCMISGTFPDIRCGVGDYTWWLCSELRKYNNIELSIVTLQDPMVKNIEGIKLKPIIKKWSFPKVGLLLRSIKGMMPDLVHIQYPTQAYKNKIMINVFPLIFKRLFRRIPLIVTIHDVKTAHILNKLRLIPLLFFTEKIILTASEEKEYVTKKFPSLKPKFETIHIGSNIKPHELVESERESIRIELGVGKDEALISHFGYLLPKKKLEIIFYSLRHLLDEGYKVKLILISSFHPEKNRYHARLKKIVDRLNLKQSVIWTGYCTKEKVSKYLFSSDICVQIYQDGVSFRRGSFIAPLNHGLPIITTRNQSLPEGLKDRDSLLVISPEDIDGLTEAIKELILSPDLRHKLSRNAKLFSERFSWDKIASAHFGLYQNILRDKRMKDS